MDSFKVISLEIENVKKIKAVRIDAKDRDVIKITGENGNGKSTILDSIAYAIGGEHLCPEQPIRIGEKEAFIKLDIGKYEVIRRWSYDENNKIKSKLEVRSDDVKLKAGQTVLNGLIKEKILDVLEFSKLEPKKRLELLKAVTGLDFDSLDKEREKLYSERTFLNRDIKSFETRIDAIKVSDCLGGQASLPSLYKEKQEIIQYNSEIDNAEYQANILLGDINQRETEIKNTENEIERLKKKIESLQTTIQKNKTKMFEIKSVNKEKKSTDEIEDKIKNATENQASYIELKQKQSLIKSLEDLKLKSKKTSEKILEIDDEKESMLKTCKMPIDGLTFDSDNMYYKGVPFEQLSSAEEISVCASVCMKYNPNFKVLYTRHGSLLDKKHLDILSDIAKKEGFQLWIELVSESPDGNSIHIVDGEIVD